MITLNSGSWKRQQSRRHAAPRLLFRVVPVLPLRLPLAASVLSLCAAPAPPGRAWGSVWGSPWLGRSWGRPGPVWRPGQRGRTVHQEGGAGWHSVESRPDTRRRGSLPGGGQHAGLTEMFYSQAWFHPGPCGCHRLGSSVLVPREMRSDLASQNHLPGGEAISLPEQLSCTPGASQPGFRADKRVR